jgi:hypothetical protein
MRAFNGLGAARHSSESWNAALSRRIKKGRWIAACAGMTSRGNAESLDSNFRWNDGREAKR